MSLYSYPGKRWCISGDNLSCQPLSGWSYSEDFIWPDTDTLSLSKLESTLGTVNYQLITFSAPEYLTVSSSGPAGQKQASKMGVYRQSGETYNNKPVWSRHDGPLKLFYDNGKFILS